jgi:hypothetical protein
VGDRNAVFACIIAKEQWRIRLGGLQQTITGEVNGP